MTDKMKTDKQRQANEDRQLKRENRRQTNKDRQTNDDNFDKLQQTKTEKQ